MLLSKYLRIRDIFDFIKRIGQEWGTTVIYTSHYMEEVEELCERVFIMDKGKEIAYGSKYEIKVSVFPNNKVTIYADNIKGELSLEIKSLQGIINLTEEEGKIILTINEKFSIGDILKLLEENL